MHYLILRSLQPVIIIFHGGQHPLRHLKQTMLCDIRNCVFVLPVIPFNQWVFGLYLPKDSLIDP